jgi:hypothetical protein
MTLRPDKVGTDSALKAVRLTLDPYHPSDPNNPHKALKSHLQRNQNQDYNKKLKDFNLLLYMARAYGLPLVTRICAAFRDKVMRVFCVRSSTNTLHAI